DGKFIVPVPRGDLLARLFDIAISQPQFLPHAPQLFTGTLHDMIRADARLGKLTPRHCRKTSLFSSGDGTRVNISKIIIGISGAIGAIYGWRPLDRLRPLPAETHLILTRSGEKTLFIETGKTAADARALADHWYPLEDIGARLASG